MYMTTTKKTRIFLYLRKICHPDIGSYIYCSASLTCILSRFIYDFIGFIWIFYDLHLSDFSEMYSMRNVFFRACTLIATAKFIFYVIWEENIVLMMLKL